MGVSCVKRHQGVNTHEFAMTGEDDTVTVVVAATLTVGCGVDLDYNINMGLNWIPELLYGAVGSAAVVVKTKAGAFVRCVGLSG